MKNFANNNQGIQNIKQSPHLYVMNFRAGKVLSELNRLELKSSKFTNPIYHRVFTMLSRTGWDRLPFLTKQTEKTILYMGQTV